MKSVRPPLAVTAGVLSLFQLAFSIVAVVLTILEASYWSWWGFGGSIGLLVGSLFGIAGGFGRFRTALIVYMFLSVVGAGFALATTAFWWAFTNPVQGAQLVLPPLIVALTVFTFLASAVGVFGTIAACAAVAYRRKDLAGAAPAWEVEERHRTRVIQLNRAVVAVAVLQMLTGIAALILAIIDGSVAGLWAFGGSIGLVVASFFGLVAGLRARRGMHLMYVLMSLTAVGFTLVGAGLYFDLANTPGFFLTDIMAAAAALSFVAAFFGFLGAVLSGITFFMYRRRLVPVAAAYPTATATTVAVPTVVVGEERADQTWQRNPPAQQTLAMQERTTTTTINEPSRFASGTGTPAMATRV